jgi:tetratricopeptide (TPR) repeat protein
MASRQAVLSRGSDDILTHINRVSYARAASWIGRVLGDAFAPNSGDPTRAIDVLNQGIEVLRPALARDPQDPSAQRVLRMCELSLADALAESDPSRAAGIYARLIDDSHARHELRSGLPEHDALWKVTYPLLRSGRYEQAVDRSRHATATMESPRAELALAEALAVTGQTAEANQRFESAIRSAELRVKERPEDMHARNDLGVAYENHGLFLSSQGNRSGARKRLAAALVVWREWPRYGVASAYNATREKRAIALLNRLPAREDAKNRAVGAAAAVQ